MSLAATSTARRNFRHWSWFGAATVAAMGLLAFLVLYPGVLMLLKAFAPGGRWSTEAFTDVIGAPWLAGAILNTVGVVGLAGMLALAVALLLAWLNECTDARLGVMADLLTVIPLLIPTVAMTIGWVFLAAPRIGFINGFLQALTGSPDSALSVNVTSWAGVVFVYTLHLVPYVYLVVSAALRNLDPAQQEASRLSGAGAWRTLRKVVVPSIKPAIIAALLLVVIVGFSVYSVPVIIANRAGIDILSVRIVRMLTFDYPARTAHAVVLSLFVLLAVCLAAYFYRKVAGAGRYTKISGKGVRHASVELGAWKWPARLVMVSFIACSSVLPLGALLLVSVQPYWQPVIDPATFTLRHYAAVFTELPLTRQSLQYSLTLGAGGALIGILIATVSGLGLRSLPPWLAQLSDWVLKLPATMSHIVIALGFLIAFSGPPFNLGGTLLLLLLVYVVIYLPEASIMANAALAQVGDELLEAARICGGSEGNIFRRILLPLLFPGLLAGWAMLFVLMAGEVTASSMLAGVRTPVVGFVMVDLWSDGTFGRLAALASGFTLFTALVVLAAMRVGRYGSAR